MYLITGGAYQGKSNYAVSVFKFDNNSIADGKTVDFEEINKYLCIKNFHILVRRMMKDKAFCASVGSFSASSGFGSFPLISS